MQLKCDGIFNIHFLGHRVLPITDMVGWYLEQKDGVTRKISM